MLGEKMKFCIKCGIKRVENAKFCGECGFNFANNSEMMEKEIKTTSNVQSPPVEFKEICETEGYYELLAYIEKNHRIVGYGLIGTLDTLIRYGHKDEYRDVWDRIKVHFGTISLVKNSIECNKMIDFFKAELNRVYGIEFQGDIRKDKIAELKKESNKSLLNGVELVLDFLSPVSAAKRVIKELKNEI
jgi:hypothetical protein